MALVLADRVKETSTTTGTGSFTLAGAAVGGFETFNDAIGNGNTTYYVIENPTANEWEVGLGTFTAPSTLARTTVYASSNSGSAVNFSAGTKTVFVNMSATKWPAGVLGVTNGGTGVTTSTGTGSGVHADNPTLTGGGTVTANNPILTMSQTWDNAAVSFKGQIIDITPLSSYSGGPPYPAALEIRNAGSPQMAIGIDGWWYPKGSYQLVGPSNDGQSLNFYQPNDPVHQINGNGFFTRLGKLFGFGQSDSASKTPNAAIGNPSTNVIEFNSGSYVSSGGSYIEIKAGAGTFNAQTTAPQFRATNGIYANSQTVSSNYTIASGDSAMSAGPITVASGVTVTVSSGSKWVVL